MADTVYKRASDFVEGIGASLDAIQNSDVLITKFRIQERERNGEKRTLVLMDIASNVKKPEETSLFHAWSDSLAEKLSEIPDGNLPLLIKFTRVATSSGFRVWTFE